MAKDYYLGIRINGVLFKIDTLNFDSDQSDYDYICNVTHVYDRNFNGRYSINITDKNYNDCVINGWKISSCYIVYGWHDAHVYFNLTDKTGEVIEKIEATGDKRSSPIDYNVEMMARSIFPRAIEVISKYPTAECYNLYMKLKNINISQLKQDLDNNEYRLLLDYLKTYYRLVEIFSLLKNKNTKFLLEEIQQQTCALFNGIKNISK